MKKIVVFGASGDTGRYFIEYFKQHYTGSDYEVIASGTRETNVFDKMGVSYYQVDISRKEDFEKLPKDVYAVVNLAGMMPATAVLMDACRKYGIERYHQVSTDEVYGDLPLDRPDLFFHEDTPIHTSSPYSTSKASADLLALAYHRTYGLPVTISRCSNNYGPYQFPEKLIPLMIHNATHDKKLPVYGHLWIWQKMRIK